MTIRLSITLAASAILALAASAQNATTNEKGATGAYSGTVDSSFTSESRFGPKTAIDELRADVDRDREQVERVRQQQLRLPQDPPREIVPLVLDAPDADETETAETPEDRD